MKALITSILVLFGVETEEQESTFYQQVEWSCLTDIDCVEECILAAEEVGVDTEICYEI